MHSGFQYTSYTCASAAFYVSRMTFSPKQKAKQKPTTDVHTEILQVPGGMTSNNAREWTKKISSVHFWNLRHLTNESSTWDDDVKSRKPDVERIVIVPAWDDDVKHPGWHVFRDRHGQSSHKVSSFFEGLVSCESLSAAL